jgi:hypothetical protein
MAKLLSGTRIYGSATIDTTLSLGTSAIFTGSTSGTTTLLATAVAGTTTLTLPAATDTLIGRATTDTLTNKTLTFPVINNIKTGYTSTTVTAGTTTLTAASNHYQRFIGSNNQTVFLPVTSTLAEGVAYEIENAASGSLAVYSSGGFLVITVIPGVTVQCMCIGTTLTTAADWDTEYNEFATITGSGSVVLSSSPSISSITVTGTMSLTGTSSSTSSFHTNQTSGTLTLGGTSGTGTITIGRSTVTQQTDIQAGATASGSTKTVNIGTSGLSGSTTNINIGSAVSGASGTTTVNNNLNVTGDLTVNGTTTTVNSTTLTVDDKNIELGSVASPTDVTADGGGITLKGATDKTITWSSLGWTSSEDFNLLTGKVYKINGTAVLSATQVLGKSLPTGDVVGSSDTQTLTNKTLSSPTLSGTTTYSAAGSTATINYNTGATPTAFDVRVNATGGNGTQGNGDYNIISGTFTHNLVPIVTTSGTQSLANKTLVSPTITGVSPTITLGGDLTGSLTLTNLAGGTLTATIAANSVALGTDTTGNYASEVVAGNGITVTGSAGEGTSFTVAHADTSSVSNLTATSRTYVTGLTFDTYGHVQSYNTASETVSNTTYSISAETATGGAKIQISGSDSSIDDVKLAAGSNINITRTDANTITIEGTASSSSSKFLVYKRGDVAPSSATPVVVSSGLLTVYGRTQNIGVLV